MSKQALLIAVLSLGAGGDLATPDYTKWLDQDVAYIISRSEKKEFEGLTEDTQRAAFVERFWQKRDPDPATERNPFQEEHYRRLKFANDHFSDGRPGWRSDRGRIYIIHGQPDQRLVFPSTELQRKRELNSGERVLSDTTGTYSGVTISIPESELWTYLPRGTPERISEHTDILFMRVSQSDALQLLTVRRPSQRTINRGEFYASGLYRGQGGAGRDFQIVYAGRPRFNSASDFYRALEQSPNSFQPAEMSQARAELLRSPGDLLEKKLQQRRQLRETVQTAVYFDDIALALQNWFLPSAEEYTSIPLAIHVPASALAGSHQLALLVQAQREDRTVAEIVDEFTVSSSPRVQREGLTYQSRLEVRPGIHQLKVYLLDRTNGRAGRLTKAIQVPHLETQVFSLSPVILCGQVQELDGDSKQIENLHQSWQGPWRMDQWLLFPQPDRKFRRKDIMTAFFEVYSPALEGSRPRVEIQLRLSKDGQDYSTLESRQLDHLTRGESTKLSYAISLSLAKLPRGRYQLRVEARDLLASRTVTRSESFEVQ